MRLNQMHVLLLMLCVTLNSCDCRVAVPSAANDQRPTVTLNVFDNIGGKYKNSYTADASVTINPIATLTFSATGYNSAGGVKNVSITLSYPASGYSKTWSIDGTIDSKNTAPEEVLLVKDGNQPIQSFLSGRDVTEVCLVTATATNFNNQSSSITITYTIPGPPIKMAFSVNPQNETDGAYINVGSSATLSWDVTYCGSNCNIVLQGFGGLSYSHLILNKPHLNAHDAFTITPTETDTKYILTATGTNGSTSMTEKIDLTNNTGSGSCNYFFFKFTSSSSVNLPCFGEGICAANLQTAQQIADHRYGGYSAEYEPEAQAVSGCQ